MPAGIHLFKIKIGFILDHLVCAKNTNIIFRIVIHLRSPEGGGPVGSEIRYKHSIKIFFLPNLPGFGSRLYMYIYLAL